MKRFAHFLAALAIGLCMAGCANQALLSGTPSPNAVLESAAQSVESYVDGTSIALARGRITADQAAQVHERAKKLHKQIKDARAALALCAPQAPCADFDNLMKLLQPDLYQLERELRAKQGAKQ